MNPVKAAQAVVRERRDYGNMVGEMGCCWPGKWREGAMSQETQAACRSWKRGRNRFSPGASRKEHSLATP